MKTDDPIKRMSELLCERATVHDTEGPDSLRYKRLTEEYEKAKEEHAMRRREAAPWR